MIASHRKLIMKNTTNTSLARYYGPLPQKTDCGTWIYRCSGRRDDDVDDVMSYGNVTCHDFLVPGGAFIAFI